MKKNTVPELRIQKPTRIAYVIMLSAATLFQLFQAGGLALLEPYLRPYATVLFLCCSVYLASLILSLCRKFILPLIFTSAGSVAVAAVGYILSHPVIKSEGYYISGIPEGVFWKFYAPCLLLIIPALMLFINERFRKKLEEDAKPYEKQFD